MGSTCIWVYILIFVKMVYCALPKCGYLGYSPWIPPRQTRNDLLCPDKCQDTNLPVVIVKDYSCCLCFAKPYWEFYPCQPLNLNVEYISKSGIAVVIQSKISNLTALHHKNGYLSRIPVNICNFTNIVKMNLERNRIYMLEADDISCLQNLDTLILSYNRIRIIANKTFKLNGMLRYIDLSNNEILWIEPGTLASTATSQGILRADFSSNHLTSVDVTNFIIEKPFCRVSYKDNYVTHIPNELDWKLDVTKEYGEGGFIDFKDNKFESFIDFRDFGVEDLTALSKFLGFNFDLRGSNWTCDCKMAPFLEKGQEVVQKIFHSYVTEVLCHKPKNLQGRSIANLTRNNQLDLFICDLSNSSVCPLGCYCYDQPNNNRIVVDCDSVGLRHMPDRLPEGVNLELYFSNNHIKELGNKEYLTRSSLLDFSENNLKELNKLNLAAISNVSKINFSNNSIKTIDQGLHRIGPCNIQLGYVNLDCKCSDKWLRDWMQFNVLKSCSTVNNISCRTSDGIISVLQMSDEMFGCNDSSPTAWIVITALGLVILLGLLFGSLFQVFSVEIYLILRKCFGKKYEDVCPIFKYDAYISFNEEVDEIRTWASRVLTKNLENCGYKICLPCRDTPFGSFKEAAINENITTCKNYIFLLSEQTNKWTKLEWKYAWSQFKSNKCKNIIIINFDQLDTSDVVQREIKAFSRLGLMLDFTDTHIMLITKVKNALGKPLKCSRLGVGLNNANVRYKHRKNLG